MEHGAFDDRDDAVAEAYRHFTGSKAAEVFSHPAAQVREAGGGSNREHGMTETLTVPVELWDSIRLALQEAQKGLSDASTGMDASEGEDYAYPNTLERLKEIKEEIAFFQETVRAS